MLIINRKLQLTVAAGGVVPVSVTAQSKFSGVAFAGRP